MSMQVEVVVQKTTDVKQEIQKYLDQVRACVTWKRVLNDIQNRVLLEISRQCYIFAGENDQLR